MVAANRHDHLDQFYRLMAQLRSRVGGYRFLSTCTATTGWPHRGVYFFFEPGQYRTNGHELRVVRVGTHAVSIGSKTSLWGRLAQHRGRLTGTHAGGGNHRSSIFRLHVGTALLNRDPWPEAIRQTWGDGKGGTPLAREREHPLELAVSQYIGSMPFLWVAVPDDPGVTSQRKVIEAGAISLLSNLDRDPIDPPSPQWLGRWADRAAVRASGLWNVQHVDEPADPIFLDPLAVAIKQMQRSPSQEPELVLPRHGSSR